jgi:tetratricopeptide (TPR) repeat protein
MESEAPQEEPETGGLSLNFAFATASLFAKIDQFIGRDDAIAEVEKCFLSNQRIIGFDGIGGMGKTFAAVKVAQNLLETEQADLKVDKVFFIDGRDGLGATFHSFLGQFIQVCELYNEIKLTKIFFDKDDSPQEVAVELIKFLYERNILFVFDNLESWLDEDGSFRDRQLYEFFFNLVQMSEGNLKFLLTSRQRFSFNSYEASTQDPRWISLKPFSVDERLAALNQHPDLSAQPPADKMKIVHDIGEHPYEIGLLAKDQGVPSTRAAEISGKREETGDFVALEYYLGQLSEDELELLHIRAIFQKEHLNKKLTELFWGFQRKKAGKPYHNFETLIQGIATKGLIAFDANQEETQLHPLIRMRLFEENDGNFEMQFDSKTSLYQALVQFFLAHFQHFETSDKEKAFGFLAHAYDYALLLGELKFINPIHQIFSGDFQGFILKHIAVDYFIRTGKIALKAAKSAEDMHLVLRVIENLNDLKLFSMAQFFLNDVIRHKAMNDMCREIAFGVQGKIHSNIKNWEKAVEAFKKSLEFSSYDEPGSTYGAVLHQLGVAYENQEDWERMRENFLLAIEYLAKNKDPKIDIAFQSLGRVKKHFKDTDWSQIEKWLAPEIITAIKAGWTDEAVGELNKATEK